MCSRLNSTKSSSKEIRWIPSCNHWRRRPRNLLRFWCLKSILKSKGKEANSFKITWNGTNNKFKPWKSRSLSFKTKSKPFTPRKSFTTQNKLTRWTSKTCLMARPDSSGKRSSSIVSWHQSTGYKHCKTRWKRIYRPQSDWGRRSMWVNGCDFFFFILFCKCRFISLLNFLLYHQRFLPYIKVNLHLFCI